MIAGLAAKAAARGCLRACDEALAPAARPAEEECTPVQSGAQQTAMTEARAISQRARRPISRVLAAP